MLARKIILASNCALLCLALASRPTRAEVLTVLPDGTGDYSTIQEAVEAAGDGDVVELGNGVFQGEGNFNVDFLGKAITIRSACGDPELCAIEPSGRGFLFISGEGCDSILEGLTVENAEVLAFGDYPSPGGAAVYCVGSSPTIRDMVFRSNHAEGQPNVDGGALYAEDSSVVLENVVFSGNTASACFPGRAAGGGMFCSGGNPVLTDVVFSENVATGENYTYCSAGGGGLCCTEAFATLTSVRFEGNVAGTSCGAGGAMSGSGVLYDVTFLGNTSELGAALSSVSVTVTCGMFDGNHPAGLEVIGDAVLDHVTFAGNGGGMCGRGVAWLTNVTFDRNHDYGIMGGSDHCPGDLVVELENTIVSSTLEGPAATEYYASSCTIAAACCDVVGNVGGDWVGPLAGQNETNGNIWGWPAFCYENNPEYPYTLSSNSCCLPYTPPNPECGLIGAWPNGCGPSSVKAMSWGAIKALYR